MTDYKLWTSDLSPFSLKIKACLQFMGHSYATLPAEGGRLANVFTALKLERAKRKGRINKFPAMTALDEYPAVPYLIDGAGTFHYDSTGISRWLDLQPADSSSRRLWP